MNPGDMPESLSIRGLAVGYGATPVLAAIDLPDLQTGELTVFAGANGAGKSTLLRALAGLARASGAAVYRGSDLLALRVGERTKLVGYMPQAIASASGLSVLDSVVASLCVLAPGLAPSQARDRALATLERIGIVMLAMTPLDQLSGGQRQLASLAQSLVREPVILLLDEPTSALDLRHQVEVMTVIRTIAEEGCIVLAVLHDLALAANWADRLVFLHAGTVAATGRPETVLTPELISRVYGVEAQIGRMPDGKLHLSVRGLA